jgi:alpha-mannosidase
MWTSEPATSVEIIESGPLHATLEIRRSILNSEYTQRISLSYDSCRLDFDTTIVWQEKHVLLKVAFPVDLLAPVATYEIQWGSVQRPTHRNTSWDWARFETCAQKWVDLSESDYGISLINDCKYGHDIHDNVMRISLLRSPTDPDPNADQGEHTFKYSLLHHRGSTADTANQAYHLNDPLIVAEGRGGRRFQTLQDSSLVAMQTPNCIIETVKVAEDGGGIIVRFYESQRTRGIVTLHAGFPIRGAFVTNLLEENQEQLLPQGNTVSLYVKPFQIVTLRLIPGAE